MENTETTEKKGFIATCASDDGAGVFAFIYVLFADRKSTRLNSSH